VLSGSRAWPSLETSGQQAGSVIGWALVLDDLPFLLWNTGAQEFTGGWRATRNGITSSLFPN
jgi:hypothetical protein